MYLATSSGLEKYLTKETIMVWGILKKDSIADAVSKVQSEALTAKQKKIDLNKNGKIDGEDLSKLRKEDAEQVEEGWDDMLKYAKEKNGPQPNGGAGKKQGTRYGGSKQKEEKPVKEEAELEEARLPVTHEDPLVTVHDKDGLHTHANLSVANHIMQTKVKHTDVHKGPVKVKSGGSYGNVTFAISQHHAKAMKEGVESLDEISKKTLSSYVSKAAVDMTHHVGDAERIKNLADRDAEHEIINSYKSGKSPSHAVASHKKEMEYAKKRSDKAVSRMHGIDKAVQRLAKEEVEVNEEADLVKTGAKQIKHANVKDKQDDQDTMEPRAQGERDFLDKLSVNVTDDPAKDGVNTGASKVSHATEPKGQGAGKYDAKEKLGKQGVKESCDDDNGDDSTETKRKKTFSEFKKGRARS